MEATWEVDRIVKIEIEFNSTNESIKVEEMIPETTDNLNELGAEMKFVNTRGYLDNRDIEIYKPNRSSQEIEQAVNSIKVEVSFDSDRETNAEKIKQDTETEEEINKTKNIININNTNYIKTIKNDRACADTDHRQEACTDLELIQRQVASWRVTLQRVPASHLSKTASTDNKTLSKKPLEMASELLKCKFCNYRCSHEKMQAHIKTNTRNKPFKCEICDHTTNRKSDLHIHMGTHSDEKLYKCELCSKHFKLMTYLRKHMRTHTGEKPHKCKFCDFRSSQFCNLTAHLRTHTGEKPYKCEVCDYRCASKGNLRGHMTTHTKERRFKCELCDKRFTESGSLKRHMILHSGEKPYKCEVCSYSCPLASWLRQHMKRHNKQKPNKRV